jgi:hypothetical protein
LRKLLSILLLALFGLPLASPLFALGAKTSTAVPSCCRRNGVHHCNEPKAAQQSGNQFGSVAEKCPFTPASMASTHPNLMTPGVAAAIYAAVVSHPTGTAQAESKRRVSADRSRQKRGPPASLSL